MAPTNVKGSSIASATLLEVTLASFVGAGFDWASDGLLSKGVARQAQEWFRIQPRRNRYKRGNRQRHCLAAADREGWCFELSRLGGWLFPSMRRDPTVVIHAEQSVDDRKRRKLGMRCPDQRFDDVILCQEACRWRYSRERHHENQQKDSRSGAFPVQTV